MKSRLLIIMLIITVLSGCDFFLRLNPTWGEGDAQLFLMAVGGAQGEIFNLNEVVSGSVTTFTGATDDGTVSLVMTETVQSAELTEVRKTITFDEYLSDNDAEGSFTVSGSLKVNADIGADTADYSITGSFTVNSEQIVFSTAVIDMILSMNKDTGKSISQEGTLVTDVKTFDITTIMDFETLDPAESWMGSVL